MCGPGVTAKLERSVMLQMGQSQTEREAVSASSDALTKLKPVFYDDSRQYQRPVQVAAAVDVSHR